ncbi:hypothetical protein FSO04_37275 [Paraburkholderia madseniana]|uniref:Uncharacterized protein n=1 Tax=Paraburkholderia madseniana TaxID=2599607 RepID=A0A6N6W5N7_9BURK|nr:FHA domain-containing protein [Paraburkholderia madseniana]KAE8754880.1 hypothetical protein FSO04_37275 [Paraburkholderia madseniana]
MLMLKVARGLHAGAELALQARSYLIGSDESSCDVVLLDDGVRPQHGRLTVTADGDVFIEWLDGTPCESGDESSPSARTSLDDNVAVTIGAAHVVVLGMVRKPSAQRDPTAAFPQADAAAASPQTDADARAAHADPQQETATSTALLVASAPSRWRGNLFGGLATVFVVLFAVGGALAVAQTLGPDDRQTQQLEAVLQLLGYTNLEVETSERGEPAVSGYLPSQSDLDRLRSALAARRCDAVLHVAVRATVQQFDTGLAKTGYRVVSSGEDVTMLEPKPAEVLRRPPAVDLRIRSASAGDDAYIETETGQRFYVGSILPGGFELADVTPQGVIVTKEDRRIVVPIH